jgi:hypothetical protein
MGMLQPTPPLATHQLLDAMHQAPAATLATQQPIMASWLLMALKLAQQQRQQQQTQHPAVPPQHPEQQRQQQQQQQQQGVDAASCMPPYGAFAGQRVEDEAVAAARTAGAPLATGLLAAGLLALAPPAATPQPVGADGWGGPPPTAMPPPAPPEARRSPPLDACPPAPAAGPGPAWERGGWEPGAGMVRVGTAEAAPCRPAADGAPPLVPMPWYVYHYGQRGHRPQIYFTPEAVLAVFGVDVGRWAHKGAVGGNGGGGGPVPPDVRTTVVPEVLPHAGGGAVGLPLPPAASCGAAQLGPATTAGQPMDADGAGSERGEGGVGGALVGSPPTPAGPCSTVQPSVAGASGGAMAFPATLKYCRAGPGGRSVVAKLADCPELFKVSPRATEGV